MKDSALSIANYFIDLANSQGKEIKPLRLMKLVYIAHGYILAIMGKSFLNPHFDRVEAWKYGPVIPSVYHSFKRFGNGPITEKTTVFADETDSSGSIEYRIVEPSLKDEKAKEICAQVYRRYERFTDWQLVNFLHKPQSPWGLVYREGENKEIPDLYTKVFFEKLLKSMLKNYLNGRTE